MSHQQEDDADYMANEYDMEAMDDDMDDEFHGRDVGGSDSDADDYDYTVCEFIHKSLIAAFTGACLMY
uniref:WD-40 repeat family protein n=1 Tax=Solanum tuberosum TaxID=4113 RepID=M1AGN8_SOLTU